MVKSNCRAGSKTCTKRKSPYTKAELERANAEYKALNQKWSIAERKIDALTTKVYNTKQALAKYEKELNNAYKEKDAVRIPTFKLHNKINKIRLSFGMKTLEAEWFGKRNRK